MRLELRSDSRLLPMGNHSKSLSSLHFHTLLRFVDANFQSKLPVFKQLRTLCKKCRVSVCTFLPTCYIVFYMEVSRAQAVAGFLHK